MANTETINIDFVKGYKDARYYNTYNNPYKYLVEVKTHTRQDAYNFMNYHNGHNTGAWDKRAEIFGDGSEYFEIIKP